MQTSLSKRSLSPTTPNLPPSKRPNIDFEYPKIPTRPRINYASLERLETLPSQTLTTLLHSSAKSHTDVCIWLIEDVTNNSASDEESSEDSSEAKVVAARKLLNDPLAISEFQQSSEKLHQYIEELGEMYLRDSVMTAAMQHSSIKVELRKLLKQHFAKKIDFETLFVKPWIKILDTYNNETSSSDDDEITQLQASNQVINELTLTIQAISMSFSSHSVFRTKIGALDAFRKIGKKTFSYATPRLAERLFKEERFDKGLSQAMLNILRGMQTTQRRQIVEEGLLMDKINGLWELGKGVGVLSGLEEILELFLEVEKGMEGEGEDSDDEFDLYVDEEVDLGEENEEEYREGYRGKYRKYNECYEDNTEDEEEYFSGFDSCGAPISTSPCSHCGHS
ncbi:MAG: hypothetical protein M1812_004878 [Candelaria pacifica]|nr:MAG: hypothetical protein M1812_004878 [Candelaria pacifica]